MEFFGYENVLEKKTSSCLGNNLIRVLEDNCQEKIKIIIKINVIWILKRFIFALIGTYYRKIQL